MSNPSHILIADDERSIRLMLETGPHAERFSCDQRAQRARGPGGDGHRQVRRRVERYLHARPGRPGTGGRAARDRPEPAHRADDRAGLAAGGRGSCDPRRQRFYRQALRYLRRGGSAAAPAGGAPRSRRLACVGARPAAQSGGPGGPQRANDRGLQADRAGRAHRSHRADSGRIRHRKGTGGARHSRFQRAPRRAPSSASTAPASPIPCWRPNSSDTRAAPLPAPPGNARDSSRLPTAAPSSWTNLPPPAPRFSRACCVYCRAAKCGASAPHNRAV